MASQVKTHAPDGKEKPLSKNGKKGKPKFKLWSKKKKQPEDVIIRKLQSQYRKIEPRNIKTFEDLPLSEATLRGLKENGFSEPTEIQRESIGFSLAGQDILGAAKTGSGKTLAFLIPVLEILYCKQWTRLDGTGALIITPTRELAYQIFETLRKIGSHHDFSAGLIIGGKDLKFEKSRMDQCNIIICTPGRLLQHMDENPLFDCVNLQVLVLDEADRCLDLGFQRTMNSIIENLPPKRQTLLFSATQTKSVRDLARLSLKDPMYVSVHEHAKHSTPETLAQSYLVCELEDKLAVLYSFIRNHLKHKVLVFMSSCKQVKYMYEAFCHLRPGVSLLALYGSLHQMRRMAIYEEFCRKSRVVMFATDIAARGLDFPAVNWVVQLDCPEDAETYIHRAGRTARFQSGGEGLLILMPSEKEPMLKRLADHKIPIKEIKVNPAKLQYPTAKLESNLARFSNIKESAQRAFVSYIKSVFLMRDKEVFNVHALNTSAYAKSLGLAIPPRIRFLQRQQQQLRGKGSLVAMKNELVESTSEVAKKIQVASVNHVSSDEEGNAIKSEEDYENSSSDEEQEVTSKHRKVKSTAGSEQTDDFDFGSDESDDDILKMKRRNHELEEDLAPLTEEELQKPESKRKSKPLTKAAVAKKLLKKQIQANKKVVFDEEGEVVFDPKSQKGSALAREYDAEDVGGIDIEKAKLVLREEDRFDKQRFREKIKAKHKEEKKKAKQKANEDLEAERDDFGSDSEDSGPDLSWLPDPDKVYAQKEGSDDGDDDYDDGSSEGRGSDAADSDESSVSSEDEIPTEKIERTKRKVKLQGGKKPKNARLNEADEDLAPLDTGLSLQEDEELALRFLRGGR